jgi:hypothetical protein
MERHKSRKSNVYSSQTVPAIVPPLSSNNKYKVEEIQRMTGAQISDHMDQLSPEEKMDFMSHLSWTQLNELTDGIYKNAASNRSSRNPDLSHLSDRALEYYKQALFASYASQNNASGLRNKKRSTRHKKRRGKKTRKYGRKY